MILKFRHALGVLMVALMVLAGCQEATPAKEATPTPLTVSRSDFDQLWQGYLPQLRGGKLHVGVATSLVGGGTRTDGFYNVIDVSKFRVSFIETQAALMSIAAYQIDLSGSFLSDIRRTQHVSGMYLSTSDSVQLSLPYSVSVNMPRFGSLTLEHNYRVEGSSIVFTISTTALPTGG